MEAEVETALSLDVLEEFATDIARRAGKLLKGLCSKKISVKMKGPVDLVTEADLHSEELIVSEIKNRFSAHGILSEEDGEHLTPSPYIWIVDPLDGTTNFAHGFPIFSVSIALEYRSEVILGVVYEPNLDETFVARKGEGSYLNGRPIRVSQVEELDGALLATGFPYFTRERPKEILALFNIFSLKCQGVRRAGVASIDLCYLAAGRFDGYWELGLKPWDTAAGRLIVEEAGGRITNFKGEKFDIRVPEVLASNGMLHDQMMEILEAVRGC